MISSTVIMMPVAISSEAGKRSAMSLKGTLPTATALTPKQARPDLLLPGVGAGSLFSRDVAVRKNKNPRSKPGIGHPDVPLRSIFSLSP